MIRPINDKVVLKPLQEEEKTKGGIVLPDTAKEKPNRGEVVAVGEGKLLDNGTRSKPAVKKGEKVIYSKFAGTEVKLNGQEYVVVDESDILAVVD